MKSHIGGLLCCWSSVCRRGCRRRPRHRPDRRPATHGGRDTRSRTGREAALPSCGDCHDQAKAVRREPARARQSEKGRRSERALRDLPRRRQGAHRRRRRQGEDLQARRRRRLEQDLPDLPRHQHRSHLASRRHARQLRRRQLPDLPLHPLLRAARRRICWSRTQLALCDTCHMTQVASFRNKPYAHRLGRGGMDCSLLPRAARPSRRASRSAPRPPARRHASPATPTSAARSSSSTARSRSATAPTCHEPHGSSNPKRLKRANVCAALHRVPLADRRRHARLAAAVVPQPDRPRYQNCTTCHVADPRLQPRSATVEVRKAMNMNDSSRTPALTRSWRSPCRAGADRPVRPRDRLSLARSQGQRRHVPHADQRAGRTARIRALTLEHTSLATLPHRRLATSAPARPVAAPGSRSAGRYPLPLRLSLRGRLQRAARANPLCGSATHIRSHARHVRPRSRALPRGAR